MKENKVLDMDFIFDIHKKMLDTNLSLVYQGGFSQEITKAFVSLAEKNMDQAEEIRSVKRKVFNVMVECLQNIVKHSNEMKDTPIGQNAIFLVGVDQVKYVISSGNIIYSENIPTLETLLNKINSLDKEGLKSYYKEVIKEGKLSEKGGAGLGLIDMARKSGEKLIYEFKTIDEQYAFFSLQILIPREADLED